MRSTLTILLVLFVLLAPRSTSAQSSPSEGDVIISEVMPDPDAVDDADGEYIELFNTTEQDLSLNDWAISDDGGSPSPIDAVTIPAEGFVVLCRNATVSANGGIDCAATFSFAVNNGTETLTLQDGNDDTVDQISYELGAGSWPDPTGASLEYTGAPGDDNDVAAHWQEATTRGGDFGGGSGDFGSPNANSDGGQLPVNLASFSAQVQRHRVALRWTTASETNNSGFAVQHRAPSSEQWTTRGFVEGAGTTTESLSYRFETDALRPGTHSFRLKQVDLDGTAHYSEPQSVRIRSTATLTLSGPNPIPAGQSAIITVQASATQPVEVALFNTLGQRVQTVTSIEGTARSPVRVPLDTESLASGVYVLRAITPSVATTRRIAVVR